MYYYLVNNKGQVGQAESEQEFEAHLYNVEHEALQWVGIRSAHHFDLQAIGAMNEEERRNTPLMEAFYVLIAVYKETGLKETTLQRNDTGEIVSELKLNDN